MGRSSKIASGSGNRTVACAFCERSYKGNVKNVNTLIRMHMLKEHGVAVEGQLPDKLNTSRGAVDNDTRGFWRQDADKGLDHNNKAMTEWIQEKRLKVIQDLRDQGIDV